MTPTRSIARICSVVGIVLLAEGLGLFQHSSRVAAGALIDTIQVNTWVNVTPTYEGAPNGGSLTPMTYNVNGVYDPASQRTISFERWQDSVRKGSIYANGLMAYAPVSNTASVLKLNNWTVIQNATGGYTTEALPANATDPTPVDRHPLGGIALDPIGNAVYLVNGANQTAPSGHPQDTWKFSLSSRTWSRVAEGSGNAPSDVGDFSGMVYDAQVRKLAYFVSRYPNGTRTWLLDPLNNQWSAAALDATAANEYIASAGVAYDTRRNLVVTYGGGYNILSPASPKLRAYSVAQNKWTVLADAPIAASSPEFAYDSRHDIFLALVGQTTLIYKPATNVWTQLPARVDRGTNLLRQNVTYNAAHDVFVFQGGTWDRPVWSLFRYSDSATTPPPSVPNTPTGLNTSTLSSSQVSLSWTASTGGTAAVGYKIYRNDAQVGTSTGTSYVDNGLAPSTTYRYEVSAYDAAGNTSNRSASATITTAAGTVSPPPPPPPTDPAPTDGNLGRGCTTAWFIDEDCDGYGPGVRSSGIYGFNKLGVGDRPDADDTSATLNTFASVVAAYDANGNGQLDNAELKTFLSQRRGINAENIFYISPTGNIGAADNPSSPFAAYNAVHGSLDAGDVVIYRAGTYVNPSIGGGFPVMASGASGNPIVFMSMPGEVVHFQTANNATFSTYNPSGPGTAWVIVDGFTVDNPTNTGLGTGWSCSGAQNVTIRNIETQRFNYVSCVEGHDNLTVERSIFHHQLEHGFYAGANFTESTNITIQDNIFYANGYDHRDNTLSVTYGGHQFNGRCDSCVWQRNISHTNSGWGFSLIQGVHNSTIRNNLIFNNGTFGIIMQIYPGDCAITGSGNAAICPHDTNNNLFLNNTIWVGTHRGDGQYGSGSYPEPFAAIGLARNTTHCVQNGVSAPAAECSMEQTFRNNVFYTANGQIWRFEQNSALGDRWIENSVFENNIVYKTGNSTIATAASTAYTFAQFESNFGGSNRNSDPLFIRANPSDYTSPNLFNLRLQSASPARDFGTTIGALFEDLTRTARTLPPDAGAYEYGGGLTSTAPAAPTNLRIVR